MQVMNQKQGRTSDGKRNIKLGIAQFKDNIQFQPELKNSLPYSRIYYMEFVFFTFVLQRKTVLFLLGVFTSG